MMTIGEARRRAARFEQPDRVPMIFGINAACWHHYPREALRDLMLAHPLLFPGLPADAQPWAQILPPYQRAGQAYTDFWGCVWATADDGITGTVQGHPLADWSALERFVPPDPAVSDGVTALDWERIGRDFAAARQAGRGARGGLAHGHTFLRLCDLRGYENLILDMAEKEPRLGRLLEMVEAFNLALVRNYVARGADWMGYPEDLGMQVGPMLSPAHFRRYIKPVYQRLIAPARAAGCIIHMHSDGDIRTLVEDLLEGGVEVLNLQDLVNGLDWIRQTLKGRVCIDLDLDRQSVTARGTPRQIDELVRREISELGSRAGGLMMVYGLYPGVPLENVRAVMDAMERYAGYFQG